MTSKLPGARAALVDKAGVTTPQFYRFLQAMERLQAGNATSTDLTEVKTQLAELKAEVDAIPEGGAYPILRVNSPLTSAGLLQNGFALLGWNGTTDDVPEGNNLYFTDARAQAVISSAGLDSLITDSGDAFMTEDGTDLLVA